MFAVSVADFKQAQLLITMYAVNGQINPEDVSDRNNSALAPGPEVIFPPPVMAGGSKTTEQQKKHQKNKKKLLNSYRPTVKQIQNICS